MGNCGSKFHMILWIKEQRVDDAGYFYFIKIFKVYSDNLWKKARL